MFFFYIESFLTVVVVNTLCTYERGGDWGSEGVTSVKDEVVFRVNYWPTARSYS